MKYRIRKVPHPHGPGYRYWVDVIRPSGRKWVHGPFATRALAEVDVRTSKVNHAAAKARLREYRASREEVR